MLKPHTSNISHSALRHFIPASSPLTLDVGGTLPPVVLGIFVASYVACLARLTFCSSAMVFEFAVMLLLGT